MASVKISELNTLVSITSDDFIPIVDSGSGTTYRATFNTLNDWMAIYGSASHADIADFAHTVTSASYANSASYALTASYATRALTASYYDLTSFNAGTATSSSYANTASCLQGRAVSWEQDFQVSRSLTLSGSAKFTIPMKTDILDYKNCIFFQGGSNSGGPDPTKNDFAKLYFIEETTDKGHVRFDHLDNLDIQYDAGPNIDLQYASKPGFAWFTGPDYGTDETGSLMFLSTGGELYVRKAEARDFTSSLTTGVGFQGTASYAVHAGTASVVIGGLPSTSMPRTVQGLSVKCNWGPLYDGYPASTSQLVTVKARHAVVLNSVGNTIQIDNVNASCYPSFGTGAGGNLGGVVNNSWYDIFLLYRSDTQATSAVVMATGTSVVDTLTFASDIYPALVVAGQPEWDYGLKVASAFRNSDGIWQQWQTYASRKLMTFQAAHPTEPGIAHGYTIWHGFGHNPVDIRISIILLKNTTTFNSWGWYKGDEFFEDMFISNYGDDTMESPIWFQRSNSETVQIGHAIHKNGYNSLASNGSRVDINTLQTYFGVVVRMWAD